MAISLRIYPVSVISGGGRVGNQEEAVVLGEDKILSASAPIKERLEYLGSSVNQRLSQSGRLTVEIENSDGVFFENSGHFARGSRGTIIEVLDGNSVVWSGTVAKHTEIGGNTSKANTVKLSARPLRERLSNGNIAPASVSTALETVSIADVVDELGTDILKTRWAGVTNDFPTTPVYRPNEQVKADDYLAPIFGGLQLMLRLRTDGRVEADRIQPDVDAWTHVTSHMLLNTWSRRLENETAWNTARVRYSALNADMERIEETAVVTGDFNIRAGALYWSAVTPREVSLNLSAFDQSTAADVAQDFIESRATPRWRMDIQLPLETPINLMSKLYLNIDVSRGVKRAAGIFGRYRVIGRSIDIVKQIQSLDIESMLPVDDGYDYTGTEGIPA